MSAKSITYGSGTKLTANSYTRKGYTFTGWNTKSDGTGTAYADKADGSKLSKKNGSSVTLYAQWKKKNYTITLKNPTRKGYTFKGWYTDSKYKNQINQIKKGSTGNKTAHT